MDNNNLNELDSNNGEASANSNNENQIISNDEIVDNESTINVDDSVEDSIDASVETDSSIDTDSSIEESVDASTETDDSVEDSIDASVETDSSIDAGIEADNSTINNKFKAPIIIILALVLVAIALILVFTLGKSKDNSDNNTTNNQSANVDETNNSSNKTNNTTNETNSDTNTSDSDPSTNNSQQNTGEPVQTPVVHVTLGQYKNIEVTKEIIKVTDADINTEVDKLLNSHTTEETVTDRDIVQNGDILTLDYEGKLDGVPFERGAATDATLEIGSNTFIPGFEDALIGKKINEPCVIDVTFPDPYPNNPDMANKLTTFDITVKEIKVRIIPELNDAFIKENTEYATVEEYKDYIRDFFQSQYDEQSHTIAMNKVFDIAVGEATFDGDIDLAIQNAYNEILRTFEMQASQYGIDLETMIMYYGMDAATFYDYIDQSSKSQVKLAYLLEEIIKAENLTLSEDEYKEKVQEFMTANGIDTEETLYTYLTREQLEKELLMDKAYNLIIDTAIIN